MTIASPTYLTAEDLLGMPDNNSMEFVNGQIVEKKVSDLSSRTELKIGRTFDIYAEATGVAVVYPQSMGYKCFQMLAIDPGRMRKPDVSVLRMDRFRSLPKKNPGYIPIVPDLAVEILSTNDVISDVDEKLLEYFEAGFPLVWIVDPILRTVTIYPNPGEPVILSRNQMIDAPTALPGFSCKVSELFPAE